MNCQRDVCRPQAHTPRGGHGGERVFNIKQKDGIGNGKSSSNPGRMPLQVFGMQVFAHKETGIFSLESNQVLWHLHTKAAPPTPTPGRFVQLSQCGHTGSAAPSQPPGPTTRPVCSPLLHAAGPHSECCCCTRAPQALRKSQNTPFILHIRRSWRVIR